MSGERPTYPIGINVFVLRDGKLLLGKRRNTSGHESWGLPGGHLESREAMVAAGMRELQEETGLIANELEFLNLVNDKGGDQHYVQIGFLARDVVGEPQLMEPDKCFVWEWFRLEDLNFEQIFFAHRNQIRNFLEQRLFTDK